MEDVALFEAKEFYLLARLITHFFKDNFGVFIHNFFTAEIDSKLFSVHKGIVLSFKLLIFINKYPLIRTSYSLNFLPPKFHIQFYQTTTFF